MITRRLANMLGGVVAGLLVAAGGAGPAMAQGREPIRITIGYQTLWAAGGEIFEVLRHTNILELNGIKGEFRKFTYGGPLGEAAVAGEIDNIYGADAPALRAAARIPGAKILHRTHDFRFGIVAQPDFKGGLTDLRGKTVSGPFGTTTFPRSMEKVMEAGIKSPFSEIRLINQDIAEQPTALQAKQVDAVTTWDPTMEKLLRSGYKPLVISKPGDDGGGWQGLSGKWLEKHGEDGAVRFLKAWIMAAWWASNNIQQAHQWFAETSRIPVDLLVVSAQADRYLRAPVKDIKTIDYVLDEQTIKASQRVMDFLHERKLLQEKMDVSQYVDMRYIQRAQREIAEGKHPRLIDIKIVSN